MIHCFIHSVTKINLMFTTLCCLLLLQSKVVRPKEPKQGKHDKEKPEELSKGQKKKMKKQLKMEKC